MKKSNAYILMYFAIILLVALLTSCSTTQHGYDYKTHHKKSKNAKPSKCYKTHNNW
jgi:predicted small secreted protein